MSLYDTIGKSYDATRRADPYITGRLIHHLKPESNSRYLDLGCGSGNYTIALKQAGLNVFGIDISERMLKTAASKEPPIKWIRGDAASLPFVDGSFAGAACILAIHHFVNLEAVFREAARVIAHGPLVIFTVTADQMERYWLREYFPHAMQKSIEQMPSKARIEDSLLKAGFNNILWELYEIKADLQDFFLYIGKNRPEMYLDSRIRQGSSTFSSLADPTEISRGCARLEKDIESGRIREVMEAYQSQSGDYAFVVARN